VHIVQSQSHILNTYDEKISHYAERKFANDEIDVITNARVSKVEQDKIHYQTKNLDTGEVTDHSLPAGLILWSTGVTLNPFTQRVKDQLTNVQKNRHALETDSHLRVLGAPLGDVYAVGDCATVQNNMAAHIVDFLRAADLADGKDPEATELTFDDWRKVAGTIRRKYPQAANHLKRLDELFYESDRDGSGTLDYTELEVLLKIIDSKLTSLPATAQRAHQQGYKRPPPLSLAGLTADCIWRRN
jgi:NADH:ubiquinone reductase (H+-translocating)